MENIVFILAGLIVGLALGYVVFVAMRKTQLEKDKQSVIEEAKMQGENLKKDRILEAKEKYMQLRSEYEKETNRRNSELVNSENRIKQKEQSLDDKIRASKTKEDEAVKAKERLDAQIEAYKLKEKFSSCVSSSCCNWKKWRVYRLRTPKRKCWRTSRFNRTLKD